MGGIRDQRTGDRPVIGGVIVGVGETRGTLEKRSETTPDINDGVS